VGKDPDDRKERYFQCEQGEKRLFAYGEEVNVEEKKRKIELVRGVVRRYIRS